jgi:formyl-CoA transferase/CoA:oxalate CoA-transferase
MGARVIKIEHPRRGDDTRHWGPPFQSGESAYFLSVNRNKESVALDFAAPAGLEILDRLLASADVFIENFRPRKLVKFGLDFPTLSKRYPRLVYCSISGFGQTGRRSDEPGYDAIAQAEAGLMSITGESDGPPIRPGLPIADLSTGMFAAYGIVAALFNRERTGRGQAVDVALLDSVVSLLTYQAAAFFVTGQSPHRLGNRHAIIAPYDIFPAADGDLVLTVGNDDQWRRCCDAMELRELASDPRFTTNADRLERHELLRSMLSERFREATRAQWLERFAAAGVPAGSVRDIEEALSDPQLQDRQMLTTVNHTTAGPIRVVSTPVKLSETPASVRTPPPALGEHTGSVLRELVGLSDAALADLARDGVIYLPAPAS